MKNIFLILAAVGLVSCVNKQEIVTDNSENFQNRYIIRSELKDFQNIQFHTFSRSVITINTDWLTYVDDIDGFRVSYPADQPENNPVFMREMSMERSKKSCSPILTGTSRTQPISLETGSASWGRMDAWDGLGKEGWEFPQGWEDMPCKKEGTPFPKEVYTLCAEKDGKTVVICINQMTDNPEQAKEIFETFRWTE